MNAHWRFTACCPFCDEGTLLIGSHENPTSGMRSDAVASCPECLREFTVSLSISPTGRKIPPQPSSVVDVVLAGMTPGYYGTRPA